MLILRALSNQSFSPLDSFPSDPVSSLASGIRADLRQFVLVLPRDIDGAKLEFQHRRQTVEEGVA
ncbi:hypothetical protein D3C81_548870 [compost metagenome]